MLTCPPDLSVNSPANCLATSRVPSWPQLETYSPWGSPVLDHDTPTPVSSTLCTRTTFMREGSMWLSHEVLVS